MGKEMITTNLKENRGRAWREKKNENKFKTVQIKKEKKITKEKNLSTYDTFSLVLN